MIKLIKKNIIFVLIITTSFSKVLSIEPQLIINTNIVSKDTIPNEIYGGFIEFLRHFVNGPIGHWSQELQDRGFDIINNDISKYWNKFGDTLNNRLNWVLDTNRYNLNGNFSQRLLNFDDNNDIGISQTVYINDSIQHDFYIYCSGHIEADSLYLSISDTLNEKVYFKKGICVPVKSWKKYSLKIPNIKNLHRAKLIISYNKIGDVYLDEASLMAENNVFGLRNEYYNFYKLWKPGIIRYPGGWFSDREQSNFNYAIGDIDYRKSPNIMPDNFSQRMDFGIDEFVNFCKSLNIEPHITVNFETGTPQLAADYFDYCNGDSTTEFGLKRIANGHIKPYGIRYWEIGNEQWANDSAYASRYLEYYNLLKKRDSSIKIIVNGNHWGGLKNFETIFNIINDSADIFSYHPSINIVPKIKSNNDDIFLSGMTSSKIYELYYFNFYDLKLREWNLLPKVRQGIGEWWTNYGTESDWLLDTNYRNYSLESGLIGASLINLAMNYPETIAIGERTCGLGLLRGNILQDSGERIFYASPTYYALSMMSNHHGRKLINSQLTCDNYSAKEIDGIWSIANTPYLDAKVTATSDTLFINILSRYVSEYKELQLIVDKDIFGRNAICYELYSDSYLDANTEVTPTKVVPKQKTWTVTNSFTVPPHSFTIIAIPCTGIIDVDDTTKPEHINFALFPNPVSDILTIDANSEIEELRILNLLGQECYNNTFNQNKVGIDIHFLPTGIYFVEINSTRKIFIKN